MQQNRRLADVICVDLRTSVGVPQSYEELRSVVAKDNKSDAGSLDPNQGVLRPWSIVLAVNASDVESHEALLESLLRSPSNPRVILIVAATADGSVAVDTYSGKSPVLPHVVNDRRDLIRVIVVTSTLGCEWRPGEFLPQGIGMWEGDPAGEQTIPILMDTLGIPEVFDRTFSATSGSPSTLWSAGTKQFWFGSLPYEPLEAALHEVGKGLVGDSQQVATLRQLSDWRVPEELLGQATEDDIVRPDGRLGVAMSSVISSAEGLKLECGLLGRKNYFRRIAQFPQRQTAVANRLLADMEALTVESRSLLSSVDARDGFSEPERRHIEDEGIILDRTDDTRVRFSELGERTLDIVVNGIQLAISSGHSLAPLRTKLGKLIERVKPRTPDKIVEGFGETDLSREAERLKNAITRVPGGLGMRIASAAARALSNLWVRLLLLLLYAWAAATAVVEAVDLGRSDGYVPLPSFVRSMLAVWTVLVFLVLTAIVAVVGVLLNRCDKRIRQWGITTGVADVRRSVDGANEYLKTTAMNDWVLCHERRTVASQLECLLEALGKFSTLLQELLLEDLGRLNSRVDASPSPNPKVRQDYSDLSEAGQFANLAQVAKIVRTDISEIVQRRLSLKVPALKGFKRDKVPQQMVDELEPALNDYLDALARRGVLDPDLAQNTDALRLRRDLVVMYWKDVKAVKSMAETLILAPTGQPLIQSVDESDLLWLDQNEHFLVRFAPEPAEPEVSKARESAGMDYDGDDPIFTQPARIAGLLRLVGFMEGVDLASIATKHASTDPESGVHRADGQSVEDVPPGDTDVADHDGSQIVAPESNVDSSLGEAPTDGDMVYQGEISNPGTRTDDLD